MRESRALQVDRPVSLRSSSANAELKVADAVWVAAAMLQREQPHREGFSVEEIASIVIREGLTNAQPQTVYQHVRQHCVANLRPDPGRSRVLVAVGRKRRLWRPGDDYDPAREGAPHRPKFLSEEFSKLIDWYEEWSKMNIREPEDPLLSLVGTGAHIWKSENADEYVRKLREGWE